MKCIDVVHLVDEKGKYCKEASQHFQAWCSSDMQNDKVKPTTQEKVLFTAVNATIQFQAKEYRQNLPSEAFESEHELPEDRIPTSTPSSSIPDQLVVVSLTANKQVEYHKSPDLWTLNDNRIKEIIDTAKDGCTCDSNSLVLSFQ